MAVPPGRLLLRRPLTVMRVTQRFQVLEVVTAGPFVPLPVLVMHVRRRLLATVFLAEWMLAEITSTGPAPALVAVILLAH